ncbi:hypothetical protein G7054_g4846 [Neopestalotiopsis clavispora]|nr:hypothetical protein G7054_g4846 [Neopestalotiopsis clavispora]
MICPLAQKDTLNYDTIVHPEGATELQYHPFDFFFLHRHPNSVGDMWKEMRISSPGCQKITYEETSPKRSIDNTTYSASVCAAGSRMWQALAERETFRTLHLTPNQLEAARKVITPTKKPC